MKLIKKEDKSTIKIKAIQPNIIIKHKGKKYDFDQVTELSLDVAEELIKLNIIEEVK